MVIKVGNRIQGESKRKKDEDKDEEDSKDAKPRKNQKRRKLDSNPQLVANPATTNTNTMPAAITNETADHTGASGPLLENLTLQDQIPSKPSPEASCPGGQVKVEEPTITEVPSKENQSRQDTNQAKTKENPAAEQSTPQGPIQGSEETPTMLLTTPRKSKHEAQWATYHGRQAWTTPRRRRSSNGELSLKVSTPEVPDYNAMNVPQLKKLCKGRRLTQGGIRQELIDKLEKDDKGRRELKIRTIVTPKRSRGGNIIVPTRDNEYGNDDYDPHKSPTLQTP